jgi:hypothetical protein
MTEAEWLNVSDSVRMLEVLSLELPQSDRKMRLAACACCRRVAHLLADQQFSRLLRLAEESADVASACAERDALRSETRRQWGSVSAGQPGYDPAEAAAESVLRAADKAVAIPGWYESNDDMHYAAWAAEFAACAIGGDRWPQSPEEQLERVAQLKLLRDIFGNPFRPVAFDPRWRSADAVGLARGVYEERAFERMPLLADALMDAECDSEEVLAHCRSGGPHVRGCWVVDLVLGKE